MEDGEINGSALVERQNDAALVERELFLGEAGKHENLRITKNVIILGLAFMLHFTAFHGTANLQSSINSSGSLGTYTLAAMYGSLILSNIFLPVAVIRYKHGRVFLLQLAHCRSLSDGSAANGPFLWRLSRICHSSWRNSIHASTRSSRRACLSVLVEGHCGVQNVLTSLSLQKPIEH